MKNLVLYARRHPELKKVNPVVAKFERYNRGHLKTIDQVSTRYLQTGGFSQEGSQIYSSVSAVLRDLYHLGLAGAHAQGWGELLDLEDPTGLLAHAAMNLLSDLVGALPTYQGCRLLGLTHWFKEGDATYSFNCVLHHPFAPKVGSVRGELARSKPLTLRQAHVFVAELLSYFQTLLSQALDMKDLQEVHTIYALRARAARLLKQEFTEEELSLIANTKIGVLAKSQIS